MKFAFFVGCTIADRLPFVEKSIRMVAPEFEIELVDLPFTCCPEPNAVKSFSDYTWLAMAARNLAEAEEQGLDILSACAGCFESLSMAKHKLDTDSDAKTTINEMLSQVGKEYKGEVKVFHLLQIFFDEIGTEDIAKRVINPLDMKVITHPGCHLLRPDNILKVDNAEVPTKLDDLTRVLGMEPMDYMDKTMCCGAGIRGTNRDVAFAVLRDKMDSMMMVNPEAIVVFCPTCFISFEGGQRVVNRMFERDYKVPVYYFTELLAIAMDLSGVESVLAGHRVKGTHPLLNGSTSSEMEVTNRSPAE
ncbi:MAG: CoB--CoM heterodisulfide reductase iron-sulfur subunit B family protein [Candidatus Thorarchaeota archaeon]